MATSVLAVKSKVHTILKDSLVGSGCDVTYGAVATPSRTWAFLTEVTYSDSGWAAVGARKRTESYDVGVVFSVILPGGNAQDTESKTLGFVNLFETALRGDPSLGGLVVGGAGLYPRSFKTQPHTDGFLCEWQGAVRVNGARI